MSLYPLRFAPIFQYRLWGGRRLGEYTTDSLPGGPVGEAWILSDRDDFPSRVTNGSLKGQTLRQLIERDPEGMLGKLATRHKKFPLLLKFLDAREMLSVQVHPSDLQPEFLPTGENGKTEAWVVLRSDPESYIYAGLKSGTTPDDLRRLDANNANDYLAGFHPKPGDGLFIEAGTVHALGGGVVVFEVQQNSDVTFRLFDWDRVDSTTGKTRELHVEKSIRCTDFACGPVAPVTPLIESVEPVLRERLFNSSHFSLWRIQGENCFQVGARNDSRVLVCVDGLGQLSDSESSYEVAKGDVWLLPASVGPCELSPNGQITLLEISIPV